MTTVPQYRRAPRPRHLRSRRLTAVAGIGLAILLWGGNQAVMRSNEAGIFTRANGLIGAFDRLAVTPYTSTTIVKWADPIRIAIVGVPTPPLRRQLEALVDQIAAVTGLSISISRQPDGSENLWLYLVSERELSAMTDAGPLRDRVLRALERDDPDLSRAFMSPTTARMTTAAILLAPDSMNYTRRISLPHELMHILGFFAHADDPGFSVLAPWHGDRYTRNDLILLRILYDPAIVAGMPRQEALQIAERITPALLRQVDSSSDPVTALAQR